MKRILSIGMILSLALFLFGCAHRSAVPYPHSDMTNEQWFRHVNTNASPWANGASSWFLTGDPNVIEEENRLAPYSSAMSTMQVRVGNFTNIKVDGPFQVQIFGTTEQNSVGVFGPNAGVRQVAVDVHGGTLTIRPVKDGIVTNDMKRVIIRVGVADLRKLTSRGTGRIEGRQLRSSGLEIYSAGSGRMYLAGNVVLRCIQQSGAGTVNVFGAYARALDITTNGSGCVNVSGNLGLRKITHHGSGNINIIGGNGGAAYINADGSGKISINGNVRICEIIARDRVCVYAYYVSTDALNVYTYNNARVGLAGIACNLYVYAVDNSRFEGRYLHAENAYVKAKDTAHVNVAAGGRIYVSATGASSIYFFGSPMILSQFTRGDGAVIPVWADANAYPVGLTSYQAYQTHMKSYAYCGKPVSVYKD